MWYKITKNRGFPKSEITKLRRSVKWKPRAGLEKAFKNSFSYYSMWNGRELIGSVRVISDRSLHAYIVDLIIHSRYQNRGLGRLLLKKVVSDLRREKFAYITLTFDPGLEDFYKKCGFKIVGGGVIVAG